MIIVLPYSPSLRVLPPPGPDHPTRLTHYHSLALLPILRMSPEAKTSSPLPKRLQSQFRPSAHRTTSQISSISVEANQELEPSRTLLSQDPRYSETGTGGCQRTRSLHASASNPPSSKSSQDNEQDGMGQKPLPPVVQRTLSAPGTPGRASLASSTSITASVYSLTVPAQMTTSGSRGSSPSRKGKEKALEDVEVDGVDVEGEMVSGHDGDATKGLRELVRRSTIGENVGGGQPWKNAAGARASEIRGKS